MMDSRTHNSVVRTRVSAQLQFFPSDALEHVCFSKSLSVFLWFIGQICLFVQTRLHVCISAHEDDEQYPGV